jgi:O-antigen/teichoic acid export membrane protein
VVWQVVHLFRSSVVEVFMPSLSRLEASGELRSMLAMNARANEMVGWLLYPLLGFTFVFASDIVILVYTAAYLEAATVMRVYIVGLAVLVIEVASMLQLLRQGMFMVYATGLTLVVSIPLSWFGAVNFGLPGAALGTVVGLYLDRVIALRRIASLSGVPVREQQHWLALAQLIGLASLASAIAWGVVHIACAGMSSFVRLAVGSAILALTYGWATRRRWAK